MELRLLGIAGGLLVQIVASRVGRDIALRGVARPDIQLRRVLGAVSTNGLPLPFGGVTIRIRPFVAGLRSVGLDLPLALALMALARDERLSPSVYASAGLALDGRLLAYEHGQRWAPVVGRLGHVPIDICAPVLPRITAGWPVWTLEDARQTARHLSTCEVLSQCAVCRRAVPPSLHSGPLSLLLPRLRTSGDPGGQFSATEN